MNGMCDKIGKDVEQALCDQHLTCVSCLEDEIFQLRAEVERLTRQVEITSDQQCPICCKSAPNDAGRIREVESERDRYKSALERIATIRDYSERGDELDFSEGADIAKEALAEAVRG